MSQIDKKLNKPLPCSCGGEINKYSIGYGRTPYSIHCPHCKCDLHKVMPSGVGWHLGFEHALEAWTDYHNAVLALKDRGYYKPTENQIREYQYRESKGWGQNPNGR